MGNFHSTVQKINFEDMQTVCKNPEVYLIINILPDTEQECLIKGTILASQEEALITRHMSGNKHIQIIIYGRNNDDEKIIKKYSQLKSSGFFNIYIYSGGLFEWLILQDIYGFDEFPTTIKQIDFLKYKCPQKLNVGLLTNY